jgi:hypothetical protein
LRIADEHLVRDCVGKLRRNGATGGVEFAAANKGARMPKTVIEQVAALKDALRGVRTAVTYKKPKDLD